MYRYLPKLVVPPGLRTLLEGLSRAVVSHQPENIPQFSCSYFAELLRFRAENPSLDIKDLVKQSQAAKVGQISGQDRRELCTPGITDTVLREACIPSPPAVGPAGSHEITRVYYESSTLTESSAPFPVTGSQEQPVSEPKTDHDQETEVVIFRRKSYISTSSPDAEISLQDQIPCQEINSALFERVPSSQFDVTSNTVLIKTPSVPCEYVIVVQSENVPETIVFHRAPSEIEEAKKPSLSTLSATPPPAPADEEKPIEWECIPEVEPLESTSLPLEESPLDMISYQLASVSENVVTLPPVEQPDDACWRDDKAILKKHSASDELSTESPLGTGESHPRAQTVPKPYQRPLSVSDASTQTFAHESTTFAEPVNIGLFGPSLDKPYIGKTEALIIPNLASRPLHTEPTPECTRTPDQRRVAGAAPMSEAAEAGPEGVFGPLGALCVLAGPEARGGVLSVVPYHTPPSVIQCGPDHVLIAEQPGLPLYPGFGQQNSAPYLPTTFPAFHGLCSHHVTDQRYAGNAFFQAPFPEVPPPHYLVISPPAPQDLKMAPLSCQLPAQECAHLQGLQLSPLGEAAQTPVAASSPPGQLGQLLQVTPEVLEAPRLTPPTGEEVSVAVGYKDKEKETTQASAKPAGTQPDAPLKPDETPCAHDQPPAVKDGTLSKQEPSPKPFSSLIKHFQKPHISSIFRGRFPSIQAKQDGSKTPGESATAPCSAEKSSDPGSVAITAPPTPLTNVKAQSPHHMIKMKIDHSGTVILQKVVPDQGKEESFVVMESMAHPLTTEQAANIFFEIQTPKNTSPQETASVVTTVAGQEVPTAGIETLPAKPEPVSFVTKHLPTTIPPTSMSSPRPGISYVPVEIRPVPVDTAKEEPPSPGTEQAVKKEPDLPTAMSGSIPDTRMGHENPPAPIWKLYRLSDLRTPELPTPVYSQQPLSCVTVPQFGPPLSPSPPAVQSVGQLYSTSAIIPCHHPRLVTQSNMVMQPAMSSFVPVQSRMSGQQFIVINPLDRLKPLNQIYSPAYTLPSSPPADSDGGSASVEGSNMARVTGLLPGKKDTVFPKIFSFIYIGSYSPILQI
ncbi:CABYR protein, partial [Atractosteus spatula]|nr:CABYR protein [Atractosteus spatula]